MATVNSTASGASTTATQSATGSTATDKSMLASNFDQFLTLLTTQLKNQNPLDPLDTNQFTQQLVQFASVEQQIKQNATLTALLTASKAGTNTNALGFVGMEVSADGAGTQLAGGSARWKLTAPRSAAQAVISIKNASGAEVFQQTKSLSAGSQDYVWSGRTSSGATAPDGTYTISVTAKDVSGVGLTVSSEITGVVDAVDLSGETPVLSIGTVRVPIDKVKSLRANSST
jgi:flagellar basal-body rod modification protein FlgD